MKAIKGKTVIQTGKSLAFGEAAQEVVFDATQAQYSPSELRLERLATRAVDRCVVTKNTYFDGGNILLCTAGGFRFSFVGEREAVTLAPGEVLVIYPGNTVTIEATKSASELRYAMFGGTRVTEFFDAYDFFDRLKFAGCMQVEAFDAALAKSANDVAAAFTILRDGLRSMSQHLKTGSKSRLYAVLAAIARGVREGKPRIKGLCNDLGISRATMNRLFEEAKLGTPSAYIGAVQYRRALWLIRTTNLPFNEIAESVGIATAAHFTSFIRSYANASPRELRNRA